MKTISCPSCNRKMNITELNCPICEVTIKGTFFSHRFGYLEKEILDFMETFVLCRGNIKEIETVLGISYPTVRAKIDHMVDEVERIKKNELLTEKQIKKNVK